MKYILYLLIRTDIPTKEKRIKIIHVDHYRDGDDWDW